MGRKYLKKKCISRPGLSGTDTAAIISHTVYFFSVSDRSNKIGVEKVPADAAARGGGGGPLGLVAPTHAE